MENIQTTDTGKTDLRRAIIRKIELKEQHITLIRKDIQELEKQMMELGEEG